VIPGLAADGLVDLLEQRTLGEAPAGHVDSLTRHGASGWAWSPAAPDMAVLVEALPST